MSTDFPTDFLTAERQFQRQFWGQLQPLQQLTDCVSQYMYLLSLEIF